ncbi:small-conductance mechanosensitive channel [Pseudomonas duriflava]|uniref:Small-conductance mechanosensitive channel n=1 Tax=Pseudomonas duriflava TaxID=459528 RepID=A0A562Q6L9_9PSED|nr:mechanosensitive ion channel family protein [Pseudomonas duriflava]TWI52415.1 small-conductance mechanosensitive channel [Pseudomonas duriflava]
MFKWVNEATVINLALALVIVVVSYWIIRRIVSAVTGRIIAWSTHKSGGWTQYVGAMAERTSRLLILLMAIQIGLYVIDLNPIWEDRVSHIWFFVLALQAGLWIDAVIQLWARSSMQSKSGHQRSQLTMTMISLMIRVALWAVVFLSVLANLGVNITAFVASLGIGGIAVALAVQNVLSDLFASLSIGIDKPFEQGDFVVFGDIAGSIEYIGLKTTRIRSLSGEQVICSNTQLLQQTIHNYKRMSERRILFSFDISYRTPPEKVAEIAPLVKEIITSVEQTRFDRAHLLALQTNALKFEVVYYVLSPDYNLYMDIQQKINLELLTQLAQREIKFGMPVRSLEFLEDVPVAHRAAPDAPKGAEAASGIEIR